jgi:UDP-N-acetylmuramate: L-alanyl-gamma-D-glutamyl-meso-diaminopimelate ligase
MTQKHAHLIGICGTAMASLAALLQDRGYRVTGSDTAAYPPMSDFLRVRGIQIMQPYAASNLSPRPDVVVVGNAISRGNPELEVVLNEHIPMRSLPQTLHQDFLMGRESLVVAGTHGKTTTTSMLAWIFETAGLKPSFLVGGIAENFGSSFALNDTKHFIIEGDEYDSAFFDKGPKFLHYFPDAAILTSVEFDHADIYKDLDAVKTAFKRFVNLVPQRGCVIAYDGNANVDECVAKAFCPVERYGFSVRAKWQITELAFAPEKTDWRVLKDGSPWAELSFALAGEFNVLNATAAAALAAGYGVSVTDIAKALASFKSVKRRLEIKARVNGVTIIDDFAHHPTAIAETLKALRTRYPQSRLWAICEPRSNTLRRKVFETELAQSLAIADEAIITSIFKPEAIAESERLSVSHVVQKIAALGKHGRELQDADVIVETISPEIRSGDVVCILSNGGFGAIYEKLPQRLESMMKVKQRA